MTLTDSSPAAFETQLRAQRAMTGEQRLLVALEMSLFARELAATGIRDDHPDWPPDRVSRELLRRTFLPGTIPAALR
jgi:hypothetical protein